MNPDIVKHYCSFQRPPGLLNIWKVVEQNWNGIPIKVVIQEIPENRYDDVVAHMLKDFIRDEAFFSTFKVNDNPKAREEIRILWKEILKCGWSVGAFIDNPEKDGKSLIAGANILYVSTEETRAGSTRIFRAFQTKNLSGVIQLIEKFTYEAELHKVYGTDKYLTALGLSVDPSFRGLKLSGHLLSVRNLIGEKYGITATGNVFTADAAINLAEREGFECIVKKIPSEIRYKNGEFLFENCKSASFQFMGKKF